MTTNDDFFAALALSDDFEQALVGCFPEGAPLLAESLPRHELAAAAAQLVVEHARALRAAFAASAPSSAAALLRLQYEAVLRSAWLLFAASDDQVGKLAHDLDAEGELATKNIAKYLDMLDAIVRAAPAALSDPLAEFNKFSRHALNSFVHAGIHPLARTRTGFPADLAIKVLQFSNAILHFAYRLLATLTGSQRRMDKVTDLHRAFSACLPVADGRARPGDRR